MLADEANVLVAFQAAGVVCRVPALLGDVRPEGGRRFLEREVATWRAAMAGGAPVLGPPAGIDPGPWEHAGRRMTCWPLIPDAVAAPVSRLEAAGMLRELHDALTRADVPGLRPMSTVLDEVPALLDRLEAVGALEPDIEGELRGALTRIASLLGDPAGWRPLHGDAHPHNVLSTPAGPVWHDFEDACLGPAAWDLACLTKRTSAFEDLDAILDAYGADAAERAALPAMLEVHELRSVCWLAWYAHVDAAAFGDEARDRLQAFRARS